jgi:hypothetical protein
MQQRTIVGASGRKQVGILAGAKFLAVVAVVGAGSLRAQAAPWLPVDDPRLPFLEHLFLRGDLRDPAPLVRPLNTAALMTSLGEAPPRNLGAASTALIGRLRTSLRLPETETWWRASPGVGIDAVTHAGRDPLHPVGDDGLHPFGEMRLEARFGPGIFVARPIWERRLLEDPDYVPRGISTRPRSPWRFAEAYGSIQTRWIQVQYGQQARNWGPPGLPGLGLSDWSYPRTELHVVAGNERLRIEAFSTQLLGDSTASGEPVHRYWAGHRFDVGLFRNLRVGFWETVVVAGRSRELEPAYRNPVVLLVFPQFFGREDNQNVLLGGDLHWRPSPGLLIEGQVALDDWTTNPAVTFPNRWGFTVGAGGALGNRGSWRARYTTVTVTAYRTADSSEQHVEAGVGLGRGFPDNEAYILQTSWLVEPRGLLLSPELVIQRQGAARLTDPYPTGQEAALLPTRLSGVVETTARLGLGVTLHAGPVALVGQVGVQRSSNDGHVTGRNATRVVARMHLRLGTSLSGSLDPP